MNQTVEVKGRDYVFISSTGHEKSNFTVMLSVLATGEKLKPLIIFKRKTLPKVSFPEGIVVKANSKGWVTSALMKEWLVKCWNERLNRDLDSAKSMIIMDSARCHITDVVKEEVRKTSKLAIIPGGLTKFLQPLDVSVNKPFKENLRSRWKAWMCNQEAAEYTINGRRKRASYVMVAKWVKASFEAISTNTIIHGFNKL
uniref:DDE-1 domain-containing protein n=1 Tax=Strongyloides venezuelensis TaxID=75913 RepID=A0A0K0FPR9_STRVS